MCFYSEENKMKRFIILTWFSFIFEKQNNFWEREEKFQTPINTCEQTIWLSGNATCVLQCLICVLAALTCPMLTSSLNLKTQTQWHMLQNLKSLRLWIEKWCPSLIVWKLPSVIGWKCKKKDSKETQSSLLFNYVNSRLPFSVLCLISIDGGSVFLQWPWKY